MQLRCFKLLFGLLAIGIGSSVAAAKDYRFTSPYSFRLSQSYDPGVFDEYVLETNSQVSLILGSFPGKTFKEQIDKSPDQALRQQLVDQSAPVDSLRGVRRRTVTAFKVIRGSTEDRVFIRYQLVGSHGTSFETNIFVVQADHAVSASLKYRQAFNSKIAADLIAAVQNVEIINSTNGEAATEFVPHFPKTWKTKVVLMQRLLNSEAQAADCKGVTESFIRAKSADFNINNAGSATFDFDKLSNAIRLSVAEGAPTEPSPECLADTYKLAIKNSSDYWAKVSAANHCSESAETPPNDDSPCGRYNRSANYIEAMQKKTKTALEVAAQRKDNSLVACPKKRSPAMDAQTIAENAKQAHANFCCELGPEGKGPDGKPSYDKNQMGPLMLALWSENNVFEDNFREHNTKMSNGQDMRTAMCLEKVRGQPDKSAASLGGAATCAYKLSEKFVQGIAMALKSVKNIFEAQFWSQMNEIRKDPSKVMEALQAIGTEIAAKAFAVTDCLGPYDKEMYACGLAGEALTILMGPRTIGMLAKALVTGVKTAGKVSGISELVAEVSNQPPISTSLAVAKAGAQKVATGVNAAGNRAAAVTAPLRATQAFQASARTAAKVTKILGKDITTPFKDLVAAKAKALGQVAKGAVTDTVEGMKIRRLAKELNSGDLPEREFTPMTDEKNIAKVNPSEAPPKLATAEESAAASTTGVKSSAELDLASGRLEKFSQKVNSISGATAGAAANDAKAAFRGSSNRQIHDEARDLHVEVDRLHAGSRIGAERAQELHDEIALGEAYATKGAIRERTTQPVPEPALSKKSSANGSPSTARSSTGPGKSSGRKSTSVVSEVNAKPIEAAPNLGLNRPTAIIAEPPGPALSTAPVQEAQVVARAAPVASEPPPLPRSAPAVAPPQVATPPSSLTAATDSVSDVRAPAAVSSPSYAASKGLNQDRFYVRSSADVIKDPNYIQNATESVDSFNDFWRGHKSITQENLEEASKKMHKVAGLGKNGDRPYGGAAQNKNITYGEFHTAESMSNARPAAEYARQVSEKLKLGPVIEEGQVPLKGIPPEARPFNLATRHYYPSSVHLDAYFKQGAKLLDQLKTAKRGSPEAMNHIADYYQVMANALPFENINNSLFMSQTNYLLSEYGFKPMSHGYLDHLAQRLNPEQFRKAFSYQSTKGLPLPSAEIRDDLK